MPSQNCFVHCQPPAIWGASEYPSLSKVACGGPEQHLAVAFAPVAKILNIQKQIETERQTKVWAASEDVEKNLPTF